MGRRNPFQSRRAGLIFKGDEAEIEPLIVSKAYRNKGIGKKLIETVTSEARTKRAKFLNIGPVARNVKAIQFLFKQGFENLGYIELFMDLTNQKWKPGPEIFGCRFPF